MSTAVNSESSRSERSANRETAAGIMLASGGRRLNPLFSATASARESRACGVLSTGQLAQRNWAAELATT